MKTILSCFLVFAVAQDNVCDNNAVTNCELLAGPYIQACENFGVCTDLQIKNLYF